MKVKIISFVLTLLMILSIVPLSIAAAEHTHEEEMVNTLALPLMCNSTSLHSEYWYTCTNCSAYVCHECYPNHYQTHTIDTVCPTHSVYYTYCITCRAYHCPNSSHSHSGLNDYYGYCNRHTSLVAYVYCSYCASYYCPTCSGTSHNHYSSSWSYSPFWCTRHSSYVASSYCSTCNYYYCASCDSSYHKHTSSSSVLRESYFVCYKHSYDVGATTCNYCGYFYCPSCGHSHGSSSSSSIAVNNPTCVAPTASVSNNSKVEYGSTITLSTSTDNATIYYTTDGSSPTIYSNKYVGPIKLTKDTTIKAMAVKYNMVNSSTSTFKYAVKSKVNFTDVSGYPGLSDSLSVLIDKGVITDGTSFGPSNGFTYTELEDWVAAIGIKLSSVTGLDHIDQDEDLTYNDFVYVLYKALLSEEYIKSPRGAGYEILKKFTYSKDITNASFYKAGFVSFYENGLFYDVNFKPDNEATRVYLATAIAAVIDNNNL